MLKKLKDKKILLAIGALVILIIAAGYFIYISKLQNKTQINGLIPIPNATTSSSVPVTPPVSIINPNDKIVSGTIVSSSKDSITLKLDDGTQQTFKPSSFVIILPIPTPGKPVSALYDPSKIKVGAKVNISLVTQDNTEVVKTVIYIK